MRGVQPAIRVPIELQERRKQGAVVPVRGTMPEMQGQMIAVSALAVVRVLLQFLLQVTIGGGGIVTSARLGRAKLIR
jgi:hypothetical protein